MGIIQNSNHVSTISDAKQHQSKTSVEPPRCISNPPVSTIDNLHIALWELFQLLNDLRIAHVLLNDDLIKRVASIGIFPERLARMRLGTLAGAQRRNMLVRNEILVHSIDEFLLKAELDKAPHVDVIQHREVVVEMQLQPFLQGSPRTERGVEPTQPEFSIDQLRTVDENEIRAHLLQLVGFDEFIQAGLRSIDVAHEEHVVHSDGVVKEEMLDCGLGEMESDVCVVGDSANVFDAVDLSDDFLHCQIPVRFYGCSEVFATEWDVPCLDCGWKFVDVE